ncbi:MAG: hypothetical protein V1813_00340 [Candidatus Aenigmatarchaeota archaeon]
MDSGRRLFLVYGTERMNLSFTRGLSAAILFRTRRCRLFSLTRGILGMKKEWRDFLRGLDFPSAEMGSRDFKEAYPNAEFSPPCILLFVEGAFRRIASAQDISRCSSAGELMTFVHLGLRDSLRKA